MELWKLKRRASIKKRKKINILWKRKLKRKKVQNEINIKQLYEKEINIKCRKKKKIRKILCLPRYSGVVL